MPGDSLAPHVRTSCLFVEVSATDFPPQAVRDFVEESLSGSPSH